MYDEKRVLKEFIEAVPIIDYVRRRIVVDNAANTTVRDDETYTIIDLACGRGYLSMILSECLPPSKVERFVLVDKGWPMHGTIPGPQHISWEHIYGIHPSSPSSSSSSSNDNGNSETCVFIETEKANEEGNARSNEDDHCKNINLPSSQGHCYYSTWPIPLNTAKVDLKKSKEIRMLERRLLSFDSSSSSSSPLQYTTIAGLNAAIANTGSGNKGPIILVAIHLCGTLSLKAVDLFNNNPRVRYFCLKPCCLPGMVRSTLCVCICRSHVTTSNFCSRTILHSHQVHVKRHEIFHLGKHTFDSKLVCMAGRWNKNEWKGPHRNVTKVCFDRWVENLYLGINDSSSSSSFCDENTKDCGGDGSKVNVVTKVQKTIPVQNDGGYQNEFLFAERRSVMGPS